MKTSKLFKKKFGTRDLNIVYGVYIEKRVRGDKNFEKYLNDTLEEVSRVSGELLLMRG